MSIVFWVVILLLCSIAELHTRALIAVFVAIGAVVSLMLAISSVPFVLQAVVWLLVSVITLLSLRPLALRKFPYHSVPRDLSQPSPVTMTGLRGFVTDPVGDQAHPGRITVRGEDWKAVSESLTPIPTGAEVVVRKAYGTTLWVDQPSPTTA
jgi:membrane protein implicated in regulation of membrane protease activity